MVRTYLTRGLLVGLLAGLLAMGFAKLVGESQIARAEQFEATHSHDHGNAVDEAPVSRTVQSTLGLGVGLLVAGAALGGIFALAFALVHGRFARGRARTTAALVAGGAFTALFLVPFLKYPANPPSIGNPDTLGHRTAVYFMLMLFGVLALVLAVGIHRRLVDRLGAWNASLLAASAFIALVVVAYLVMPGIEEIPAGFPAGVLWKFRLASLGTQAVLWLTLGLGFGALTERRELAGR
jgi:predicted cobalt transporter CbtA